LNASMRIFHVPPYADHVEHGVVFLRILRDERFRARMSEKGPLGVKNTFLGNTSKKK
jgi:hypothetical protein